MIRRILAWIKRLIDETPIKWKSDPFFDDHVVYKYSDSILPWKKVKTITIDEEKKLYLITSSMMHIISVLGDEDYGIDLVCMQEGKPVYLTDVRGPWWTLVRQRLASMALTKTIQEIKDVDRLRKEFES